MDQFLTVATFNDREPAARLAALLTEAGLSADVFDESAAQKWLMFSMTPHAHMRVRVNKEIGERALDLIKELHASQGVLNEAVRCPQCGSSRVEYPQISRRTVLPSLLGAVAGAAGIMEKEYFCEACSYTWPEEEKVEAKIDILGWKE